MMRVPAKLANLYELHEFLENGFTIFKETKDADKFINALIARESAILEDIFSEKEDALSINRKNIS